ncbi:MAG: hypothetical protein ACRC6H_01600 [Culicoidibacterales bacterium]
MERSTWLTILIIVLIVSVALVGLQIILNAFAFIFQYAGVIALLCILALVVIWNWRK